MAESDNKQKKEEIFSRTVRAGKRTYFFDVKATRSNEYYLTITESKRRFNNEQGKFFYEKHKIFLYKEDFEKFTKGLNTTLKFITTGELPEDYEEPPVAPTNQPTTKIEFEDLDKMGTTPGDGASEGEKEIEESINKNSTEEKE